MWSNWNSCILLEGWKKVHTLWKTVWQFLIKLSIYVSSDSVGPLLGISPWEIITCVYRKIYTWILILSCPKLEKTQVPFNWQLDKKIIAYWHNEILHKIKKKQSIDTGNNMDRSQKQTKTKDAIYITISKWQT